MNDIIGKLKNNEHWTISVQLLVLYVVSVGIFMAAYEICLKVLGPQRDKINAGSASLSALAFGVSAAVNFGGVALLAFICVKTGAQPRLAMIAVPLFLSLEKHVRAMREKPAERRFELLGSFGVLVGMAAAAFLLLRHAPVK